MSKVKTASLKKLFSSSPTSLSSCSSNLLHPNSFPLRWQFPLLDKRFYDFPK